MQLALHHFGNDYYCFAFIHIFNISNDRKISVLFTFVPHFAGSLNHFFIFATSQNIEVIQTYGNLRFVDCFEDSSESRRRRVIGFHYDRREVPKQPEEGLNIKCHGSFHFVINTL